MISWWDYLLIVLVGGGFAVAFLMVGGAMITDGGLNDLLVSVTGAVLTIVSLVGIGLIVWLPFGGYVGSDDAPTAGFVQGKEYAPAHVEEMCYWAGKVLICDKDNVPNEFRLKLATENDEAGAWRSVPLPTFNRCDFGEWCDTRSSR